MASITERMKGAALLDVATYEEVEADTTATGQAAVVVALGAIASGIGMARSGSGGIIAGVIGALIGWVLWAGITYLIGDKVLGGTASWGELLRTLGFAQAPRVLAVLGIIPGMGWLVALVIGVWVLVTGVVAIRQALDFSTGKAIATAILGWFAMMIPMAILGLGHYRH
jgi:hypothetical protein